MPAILVTGFKSCGKSTVGHALAQRLKCAFSDLDSLIEKQYERTAGEHLNFRAIFKHVGEDAFRAMELKAACEVRDQMAESDDLHVIALGGGALMQPETRAALCQAGKTVFLYVPWKAILDRIKRRGFPAFITSDDPEKELRALFDEREVMYRECADAVVNLGFSHPQQAARKVQKSLVKLGVIQDESKGKDQ